MLVPREERPKRSLTTRRVAWFASAIALAMTTLVVRLGYVQITLGRQYDTLVQVQNYSTLPIPGPRGKIFDSQGMVLATNTPQFSILYVRYPNDSQSARAVAKRLAGPLGMKAASLYRAMVITNQWEAASTLTQNATPLQISYVAEHRNSLPGIIMMATPRRVYPQGVLAAHELGYVGPIPSSEASWYAAHGYSPNDQVGLAGLEQQYQSVLRGHSGAMKIPVNNAGVPQPGGTVYQPPTQGNNLILNMNGALEKDAEQALISRIQYLRNRGETNVHSGTIVVMNVHTGAVLAMASYPTYNPNWWTGGISQAHYQQYLANQAGFNRAISGLYMPGSTQKMLTAMAALMNHEITPSLKVNDQGGLWIGNYFMQSWNPVGFGVIGLRKALEVSDDTYFYQVGLNMGHYNTNNPPNNIAAWLNGPRVTALKQIQSLGRQFGLTSPTGIDLPGEQTGYVTFSNPPTLYDLPAAAIGQMEAYSTIGLTTYIAAIANGGYRYQPQMVHEITSPSGKVLKVFKPHLINKVNVKPKYIKLMQQGLEMATHGSLGTATYFFGNDPVNVAGKTGTAETANQLKNNSVFVGYAPYNHPQIAVAAVIPNVTGEGFHAAAPMAQIVIDDYFALQKQHAKKP